MPYGKIWTKSKEEFAKIIAECTSFNQVLKFYNETNGGFIATVKNRIKKEKHDISHFNKGIKNRRNGKRRYSLEEILVENSTYSNTSRVKKMLYKANLLDEVCVRCGIEGGKTNFPTMEGFNNTLVLQLDHINGIHNDNRIENLRILCPNCHSQTTTFCSKNNKLQEYKCIDCDIKIKHKQTKRCLECHKAFLYSHKKNILLEKKDKPASWCNG